MLSNPKDTDVLPTLETAALLRRRTDRADELALVNQSLTDTVREVRRLEAELASREEQIRTKIARLEHLTIDLRAERDALRAQLSELAEKDASALDQARSRERKASEERSEAQRRIAEIERELTAALEDVQLERGRGAWFTRLAERQSARATEAEERAVHLGATLGEAIAALVKERENGARLQQQVDEALTEWYAAATANESLSLEVAAWVAECESALERVSVLDALNGTLAQERDSANAALEERSRELLRWLDELETLNSQAQTLQQRSIEQTEETRHWRERSEALEGQLESARGELKEQTDAMIYWRGRCEALEVHLANARNDLAVKTADLERRIASERAEKEQVSQQLTDLTERFSKFAEIELARTRSEIAHVSAAIDLVQGGRVWKIKRAVGRLLRWG